MFLVNTLTHLTQYLLRFYLQRHLSIVLILPNDIGASMHRVYLSVGPNLHISQDGVSGSREVLFAYCEELWECLNGSFKCLKTRMPSCLDGESRTRI